MSLLLEYVYSLGPWNWFILAVVLFVLEFMVPGVHFLWFGLAAIIVGILGFAADIAWQWQLIIFALISVSAVFLVRRYADPRSTGSDLPHLNIRGAQYIGRIVTVEDDIVSGRGKVRVGDSLWAAQGPDSAKGTRVKITGINGTVLTVEPAGT